MTQLLSRSMVSSVGVVVVGGNRYTGEVEKWVFEVTMNHDRLMGVFTDRADPGMDWVHFLSLY